jgi:hypothetical protein
MLAVALLVASAGTLPPARGAEPAAEAEPTAADCAAAIDGAQALARTLPEGDLARHFAERYLMQASAEAGNGEYDECLDYAARAVDEVRELRHRLAPGERLDIRSPND